MATSRGGYDNLSARYEVRGMGAAMANGRLLRQLIKSGVEGDDGGFRRASEAVIAEERDKQHHLLASDLERLLYGKSKPPATPASIKAAQTTPMDRERGLGLIDIQQPTRELRDIVLAEGANAALEEILLEHNRSDVLRSHGLEPAQKILFCGPPGCGKTLAAEVLAMELSMPLALVRLDSVVSSFLGETAANLRKVFDYIAQTPVVALFDEFDALAKSRDDKGDHGELKRVVNAVLQMMDGYRGRSVLIAATNHDALLDSAIWRRFDEVVRFELPTLDQIKRLLALKLSGTRRQFEPTDTGVANLFKGIAHADIERVLRRAVKEMVLQGREFLSVRHLEAALQREYAPRRSKKIRRK